MSDSIAIPGGVGQVERRALAVGDTVAITDLAMLYTDRDPDPPFYRGLNRHARASLALIERLIGKCCGDEPKRRRRFDDDTDLDDAALDAIEANLKEDWHRRRRSWSFYCDLFDWIKAGHVDTVQADHFSDGSPNPMQTSVSLSDERLLERIRRRRDYGVGIAKLLAATADEAEEMPAEDLIAHEKRPVGRPRKASMPLIVEEHEKRKKAGEPHDASSLLQWYCRKYPKDKSPPNVKTIRNQIPHAKVQRKTSPKL